jgi:NAD(P)H-dependent flavin oxidoreductase YrpB (nitropropane dioxygenase family)
MVTRLTEMFGCVHRIQQAGMGGMASPDLAIAVARAGGIGMLSGAVGRDALAAQLNAATGVAPIGVNFLMPFFDPSALEEAATRCPLVEFFWATPDAGLVATAHVGDAKVAWQIGSVDEAKAAADAGCDVVVVQGTEAGGHVRGTTALAPLLDAVRAAVDLPLVASGGIGSAHAMATALDAGADGVRVGTRFLAALESPAHPDYVEALIGATAADTVVTTAFGDGWPDAPHRVLRSAIEAGEALGDAQSWNPSWPQTGDAGDIAARALYAGTSVGDVHGRVTVAAIIDELTS